MKHRGLGWLLPAVIMVTGVFAGCTHLVPLTQQVILLANKNAVNLESFGLYLSTSLTLEKLEPKPVGKLEINKGKGVNKIKEQAPILINKKKKATNIQRSAAYENWYEVQFGAKDYEGTDKIFTLYFMPDLPPRTTFEDLLQPGTRIEDLPEGTTFGDLIPGGTRLVLVHKDAEHIFYSTPNPKINEEYLLRIKGNEPHLLIKYKEKAKVVESRRSSRWHETYRN
ncbi:hypothetical protein FACS1894137_19690 [Spirochaetia bacterium]|nr:hypothetical protein FACS1894137_19690 [Spirochaetia bacterium]